MTASAVPLAEDLPPSIDIPSAPSIGSAEDQRSLTPEPQAVAPSRTPEYSSWRNMVRRCRGGYYRLRPEFETFDGFMKHVGPMPSPGMSIDRVDPNDPVYGPGSVRWADRATQAANRRNTRWVTSSRGECLPASEWARRTGIPLKTILSRLNRGAEGDEAIYGGPKRLSESPPAGSLGAAASDAAVMMFARVLRENFDEQFFPRSPRYRKMLGNVLQVFSSGGVREPLKALELVLSRWPGLRVHARDRFGVTRGPDVPTVDWLAANVIAAGSFVQFLQRRELDLPCRPDVYSVTDYSVPLRSAPEGGDWATFWAGDDL